MQTLQVHFLPRLTDAEQLAGGAVAVIDVLRASTTICHALAAGALGVIPCLEVDEAHRLAATYPAGEAVLGGERQGMKISGFDLGNSPAEYTPQSVGGRTVIFTTTNGTQAMRLCRASARVMIGAFVNATAVLRSIEAEKDVHLLCAGTRGAITREDVLLAGLLVHELMTGASVPPDINDEARLARDAWRQCVDGGRPLAEELRATQGGRNLAAIGLDRDLEPAAWRDRFDFVPTLDVATWSIRLP